jgi:hypothetical protein
MAMELTTAAHAMSRKMLMRLIVIVFDAKIRKLSKKQGIALFFYIYNSPGILISRLGQK